MSLTDKGQNLEVELCDKEGKCYKKHQLKIYLYHVTLKWLIMTNNVTGVIQNHSINNHCSTGRPQGLKKFNFFSLMALQLL